MLKHSTTSCLEEPMRSFHEALFAQVRVLRQSFKERHSESVAITSPLMPWILQHAVSVVNRLQTKTSSVEDCIRRSVVDTPRFSRSSQGQAKHLRGDDDWERILWPGENPRANVDVAESTREELRSHVVKELGSENGCAKDLLEGMISAVQDVRQEVRKGLMTSSEREFESKGFEPQEDKELSKPRQEPELSTEDTTQVQRLSLIHI